MILPTMTSPAIIAQASTVWVMNNDQRSKVDKCLEDDPDLTDLLMKGLANEPFTEEDTARIAECLKKRKEFWSRTVAIIMVIIAVVVVALLVWVALA